MPIIAWIAVLFVLTLAGFVLALRSTPKAGHRPPVKARVRNTDPALFEPSDPDQRSFPRGTWVQ